MRQRHVHISIKINKETGNPVPQGRRGLVEQQLTVNATVLFYTELEIVSRKVGNGRNAARKSGEMSQSERKVLTLGSLC